MVQNPRYTKEDATKIYLLPSKDNQCYWLFIYACTSKFNYSLFPQKVIQHILFICHAIMPLHFNYL